jgi:glycosyltransferase involved in cell wall biosynthesis
MPAYNAERYIAAALSTVLQQTHTDYEIIVVDDGSADGTREEVRRFAPGIRYTYQDNHGAAAARNAGIRAARGEFVCFLDADDAWLPAKLAAQIAFMDTHPSVGLLFADEEEFDEQTILCPSLLSTSRFCREFRCAGVLRQPFAKLLVENFIPTSTVMIRKRCFNDTGVFDVALKAAEDRDLWSRIAVRYPVACLPAVLGRKRVVASSLSRDVEATLRSRIIMWKKLRRLYPELVPRRDVDALLAPTYTHLGFVLLNQGRVQDAREAARGAVAVARSISARLWAVGLLLCTFAGKATVDFAFETKRRLFGSHA